MYNDSATNHSSLEKSFRINHDERFFSKLMSKEKTTFGNTSSRVLYYGEKSVKVPFIWEAQPGTPKHPLSEKSLPPLSPPPSYYNSNNDSIIRNNSKLLANNTIISTIWPKISCSRRKKKKGHNVTPSSSLSWSPSSSSLSSSSNLSLAHSSSSLSMRDKDNHHGQGIRSMSFSGLRSSSPPSSSALGSPNNLKHKCSSNGFIRGCYPFGNMKNATV